MIEVSHVSAGYGGQDVLKDLSFSLSQGENLAILGPNGCGKTTLLRVMAGLLPCRGDVSVDGKHISRMKPRELAAHIGLMSQNMQIPFDYTVADVVRMGRYRMRRHGLFEAENREDEQAVRDALETVGLWALRDRAANTLSGGQQQRVFLARVFAQQPEIVMLDEPTNHLDLSSQIELMQQLRLYGSQPNRQVIGVFHDLTLAPMLGGQAIFMREGQILRQGAFSDIASPSFLRQVYGVDVRAHLAKALEALPKA